MAKLKVIVPDEEGGASLIQREFNEESSLYNICAYDALLSEVPMNKQELDSLVRMYSLDVSVVESGELVVSDTYAHVSSLKESLGSPKDVVLEVAVTTGVGGSWSEKDAEYTRFRQAESSKRVELYRSWQLERMVGRETD